LTYLNCNKIATRSGTTTEGNKQSVIKKLIIVITIRPSNPGGCNASLKINLHTITKSRKWRSL